MMRYLARLTSSLLVQLSFMLSLFFVVALVMIISGLIATVHFAIQREYDSRLQSNTNLVMYLYVGETQEKEYEGEDPTDHRTRLAAEARRITAIERHPELRAFRIWQGNNMIARSQRALISKTPSHEGLYTVYVNDVPWRVYTINNVALGIQVEGWEQLEVRNELRDTILANASRIILFILAPLLAIMVYLIHAGLASFRRLDKQIALRGPADLAPIELNYIPSEVLPVVTRLNQLLTQLDEAFVLQRQIANDTAHELRTPLAALKVQLHQLRRATDEGERQQSLHNLELGVSRASRLFEQMLKLARIGSQSLPNDPLKLRDFLIGILPWFADLANEKGIELGVEGKDVELPANRERLELLVGILLENAIKYSPPDTEIIIRLLPQGLSVIDQGTGIPEDKRKQVFTRFFRLNTQVEGSGLGLAIAREICNRQGWHIWLQDGEGGRGLRVDITLTTAPAAL